MATNSSRLPGSLDPLLLSNDRPSPGQASSISKVIETLTHDLSNIDASIACLKTEVARLETTKSTLQHDVERYSSLLSSVRQLPPEIIRVVMLACFDEDDFDQDQVKNLSLVSRQWYQVAVSTPRLWSSYTIDTEGLDKESVSSVIHKASTHLSKAASLPLHLRYTVDCGGPDSTHALDYIHSLSPQLRVLHIDLISETQDDVAGEFNATLTRLFRPPTIWPVLHTLSLIMHTDQGYFDDSLTGIFPLPTQSFPALKVAELDLVGESLSPRAVRELQSWGMPWAQLSRLFIGPCAVCSPSDVVGILRESTSLEECYIDVPGYNDSYWGVYSTDAHITLPKVTKFTLKAEDEWMAAGILNHLTLPSLRRYHHDLYMGYDFEVPNPEHPDPGESPAWQAANAILHPIIELFTRSGCSATLETLDLNLASGLKALARLWSEKPE
ncbi:hypothetical protein FA13DRAFT_1815751 [Coprinellus micaceus]|uniref:Uncharacterized protein n=1 Tax=Coprinellus micaceus TaxID=71717 RepID=A0A4Y7T503_COPMI|nr:hypothetical protein FA13DRAFT_1815751 [Coprinellus micaceus]